MKVYWKQNRIVILKSFFLITINLLISCTSTTRDSEVKVIESEGFRYEVSKENKSECIIIGYTGTDKDLIIPKVLNRKKVVRISYYAFQNMQLTSVTIPDSVTSIGNGAFYLNLLTSIIIPDSVKIIGNNAFANNQLTNVIIGNNVESIGTHAFSNTNVIITGNRNVSKISYGETTQDINPLSSITIKNQRLQNIRLRAYGDFTSVFLFNYKKSGNYYKHNEKWIFNGETLIHPSELRVEYKYRIKLISINGGSPESYTNNLDKKNRSHFEQNGLLPYPTRITAFYDEIVYLPPGRHTIEVVYLTRASSGDVTYSTIFGNKLISLRQDVHMR